MLLPSLYKAKIYGHGIFSAHMVQLPKVCGHTPTGIAEHQSNKTADFGRFVLDVARSFDNLQFVFVIWQIERIKIQIREAPLGSCLFLFADPLGQEKNFHVLHKAPSDRDTPDEGSTGTDKQVVSWHRILDLFCILVSTKLTDNCSENVLG